MKKQFFFVAILQILFAASIFGQKYENGTRLLKGAEVLSATPLQLDYVLETLADTAKITVNLHEGKTHLVLNDGSGKWREWWYYMGKWRIKTGDETDPTVPAHIKSITDENMSDWFYAYDNSHKHSNKSAIDGISAGHVTNWNAAYDWGNHATQGYLKNYTLPVATTSVLGGVKAGSRVTIAADGTINANPQDWTNITGKPTYAIVATSGSYNDLTNLPTIPAAFTLPAATTTTLGGVKVGVGLSVTEDGTLSANGNINVSYGTFNPVIMGTDYVWTLTGCVGRYWIYGKMVQIEVIIWSATRGNSQGATDLIIYLPDKLIPGQTNIGGGSTIDNYAPVQVVKQSGILEGNYTQLSACVGNAGIELYQNGQNASYKKVKTWNTNTYIHILGTYLITHNAKL